MMRLSNYKKYGGAIGGAAMFLAGVRSAQEAYKEAKSFYTERFLYNVEVSKHAYVYNALLEWLNGQLSPKSVRVKSRQNEKISRQYNNPNEQSVIVNGRHLKVRLEMDTPNNSSSSFGSDDQAKVNSIRFVGRSSDDVDAVFDLLEELTEELKKAAKKVYMYYPETYGWEYKSLSKRNIESVFLPTGEKEALLTDLKTFFDNEDHYARIGAPWHRGYLLYGEPGNGKSSLVSAIASHLKLNLYTLPLSSVKTDADLASQINSMGNNCVLLLEDIDIFTNSMNREQADSGPTLAGLLNALDGVGTPHGMLTFITTNHLESLDEALIRNGRIDYRLELKKPTEGQVREIYKYAYGENLLGQVKEFKNMAEVANVLKTNIDNPDNASKELTYG